MNKTEREKREREVKLLTEEVLALKVKMEGILKAYSEAKAKLVSMQARLTTLQQYLNAPQI